MLLLLCCRLLGCVKDFSLSLLFLFNFRCDDLLFLLLYRFLFNNLFSFLHLNFWCVYYNYRCHLLLSWMSHWGFCGLFGGRYEYLRARIKTNYWGLNKYLWLRLLDNLVILLGNHHLVLIIDLLWSHEVLLLLGIYHSWLLIEVRVSLKLALRDCNNLWFNIFFTLIFIFMI